MDLSIMVDIQCQIFCDGKFVCDAKPFKNHITLNEGHHSIEFKNDGQSIKTIDYYAEPDNKQKSDFLRVSIKEKYRRICQEKIALINGKSLREELEGEGYSLISIQLEKMCAVLPEEDQDRFDDADEFDFVKAIIKYGPQSECDLDCPYLVKPGGRPNRSQMIICSNKHPDIRCKRGINTQTKVYYPYFQCSHRQFDAIQADSERLRFVDLIIFDDKWVEAKSLTESFIPTGKHYDTFQEFILKYKFIVPKTPPIDIDWIEEHGWPDD